ncbi:DEAD/DEAH box helicase [Methylobacterium planeticum]|uniref:DEAD/DEAH box helicase n=1 Tax=Methylobacterium planeticum TaxID=2615211 RepID=A0A6N6MDS1_9HYPH|nr:DEAD/DEAH box helicase [Methylobacterium planeticum]KAB1068888.1 DEAD/DEAH box helicase [Methylobacterium planeticum]
MTQLRSYQRAGVDAVFDFWAGGGENPLVEAATGTGKSVMVSTLTREVMERWPDMRVLMLVHVKELVQQNAQALLRSWPGAPVGINSAGLGRRDLRSPILFASIQSVYRQGRNLGPRDLILIDEAHLVPKAGDGMYRRLLDDLQQTVPDLRVAGFTATPYRLDSGRLDEGDDRLFSEIVFSYGIGQGIADGYLSSLVSKATDTTLDVSGVARRGGEFVAGALEAACDQDAITQAAVDELAHLGRDRRSWLLFAAGVKHAANLRDAVRARGIACEMVSGETPQGERDRIVRDFREGRLRCLTNCSVLTTGFDAPAVDLVAMLRPTLSVGLYVQIVGRGTRLASGKENCLILDYAGNVRRHGPVDAIEVRGKKDGSKPAAAEVTEVRAKECPSCSSLVALNTRVCTTCGHEWTREDAPKHDAVADAERAILSLAAPPWLEVSGLSFARHTKPGSPDSLRAEFHCGILTHRVWVCLEHGGRAAEKAAQWWRRMGGAEPVPATVEEGLERAEAELVWPHAIQARQAGKFWEIVGYRFAAGEGWSTRAVLNVEEAA